MALNLGCERFQPKRVYRKKVGRKRGVRGKFSWKEKLLKLEFRYSVGEADFVEAVWAAFERTILSPLAVLRRLREILVGPQVGRLRQAVLSLIALSSTSLDVTRQSGAGAKAI